MAKEPTNYPSDAADKYVLRFPDGMRDRLKQAAAANNRTLNAEIVARLQRSFDVPASFLEMPAKVISSRSDGSITEETSKEMLARISRGLQQLAQDVAFLNHYASGDAAEAALMPLPEPPKDEHYPIELQAEMDARLADLYAVDPSLDSSPPLERTEPNRGPDPKPSTPSPNAGKPKG